MLMKVLFPVKPICRSLMKINIKKISIGSFFQNKRKVMILKKDKNNFLMKIKEELTFRRNKNLNKKRKLILLNQDREPHILPIKLHYILKQKDLKPAFNKTNLILHSRININQQNHINNHLKLPINNIKNHQLLINHFKNLKLIINNHRLNRKVKILETLKISITNYKINNLNLVINSLVINSILSKLNQEYNLNLVINSLVINSILSKLNQEYI